MQNPSLSGKIIAQFAAGVNPRPTAALHKCPQGGALVPPPLSRPFPVIASTEGVWLSVPSSVTAYAIHIEAEKPLLPAADCLFPELCRDHALGAENETAFFAAPFTAGYSACPNTMGDLPGWQVQRQRLLHNGGIAAVLPRKSHRQCPHPGTGSPNAGFHRIQPGNPPARGSGTGCCPASLWNILPGGKRYRCVS